MGKPHILEAREYKLLLDPAKFAGEPEALASAFWEERLKPVIEARLGPRSSGKPRAKKAFTERRDRRIRFRDTGDGLLGRCDYSLRERVDLAGGREDDASRQVTLKLRTADLFVSAKTDLPGTLADAQTKFEEDIGPLEVTRVTPKGKTLALAEPRSTRSRFSLSTTQGLAGRAAPDTLGALFALYPSLKANLGEAPADQLADICPLVSGRDIDETVMTGAQAELGQSVKAGFALTLWSLLPDRAGPAVAEISYRCELEDGEMPGMAARRARALFIGLQEELGGWLNLREASKTALAQPSQSGTSA